MRGDRALKNRPSKSLGAIGLLSAAMIALIAQACLPRQMLVAEMTAMVETGLPELERGDDPDMVAAGLPAQIKLLETFLASHPSHQPTLVLLARLYASYAFIAFEPALEIAALDPEADPAELDRLKDQISRIYQKGARYASTAIGATHPVCRQPLAKGKDVQPCLTALTRAEAPAAFWYGFNLGAYVQHNRDAIRALGLAHLARSTMERVDTLAPDYYHGGAALALFTYHAALPAVIGGKPQTALDFYERTKKIAGHEFLTADLYFAKFYLQPRQERDQFEKLLTMIVQNADKPAPFRLLNKVAAKRAATLLRFGDQIFE